jgi:superfamily II DNA/RNA helicase
MRPQPGGAAHDAWPSPTTVAGSPRGDAGPTLNKWEQLALSPALLGSLSKFGVGPPNKIQQRALPFLLKGADIIAQAPPTQERIAAYVIPAIQVVLRALDARAPPPRGPLAILVSTTVDQATQAQRMIRDLGGPIGVRSALGVGAAAGDASRELGLLAQNMPHIVCGTPQKLHALFTGAGGLPGGDVRFLVLDEVDQLLARNLHEYVCAIVKLLPPPRRADDDDPGAPERQTALFSNTVPQDVLNLANVLQLREPVRVLVRRDGTVAQAETPGGAKGLKQFYLFLSINPGGRGASGGAGGGASPGAGHGPIGSGRGGASAETAQAREWKLDALADLFDDVEAPQAIVHVGGMTALDAVVYKLVSRGVDAVPLHGDMTAATKAGALAKFRGPPTMHMRTHPLKALVVYDVQLKAAEVSQVPLVVNYDLPKAVEEYAHRYVPTCLCGRHD